MNILRSYNLLNDNQLLEMAQDRHQWRKLVVDCSAAKEGGGGGGGDNVTTM